MVLLITHTKNHTFHNYGGVAEAIKDRAATWWHHIDQTWLVRAELTPAEWVEVLRPLLGANDNILVIEVERNYQGWLPQRAWDWINNNVW